MNKIFAQLMLLIIIFQTINCEAEETNLLRDKQLNNQLTERINKIHKDCLKKEYQSLEKQFYQFKKTYKSKQSNVFVYAMAKVLIMIDQSKFGTDSDTRKLLEKETNLLMEIPGVKQTVAGFYESQFKLFFEVYGPTKYCREASEIERIQRASMLLKKLNELHTSYTYHEAEKVDAQKNYKVYRFPESYKGFIANGMAPESIKDPKIRKEYANSLRTRKKYSNKYRKSNKLLLCQKEYRDEAIRYLQRLYSKEPGAKEFGPKELEPLINEFITDPREAQSLIDLSKSKLKSRIPEEIRQKYLKRGYRFIE